MLKLSGQKQYGSFVCNKNTGTVILPVAVNPAKARLDINGVSAQISDNYHINWQRFDNQTHAFICNWSVTY